MRRRLLVQLSFSTGAFSTVFGLLLQETFELGDALWLLWAACTLACVAIVTWLLVIATRADRRLEVSAKPGPDGDWELQDVSVPKAVRNQYDR